jgi:Tol biopolymer transport system component
MPHKLSTNVREISDPEWSHDGRWIYFRGYGDVDHQLYRCPAQGGDASLLASSLDPVQPTESPDGKVLYFLSREADAVVMMLPLDQPIATPQPVPGIPHISYEHRWDVAPNGIYYIPQSAPRALFFYRFATKRTHEIFKSDRELAEGISVSPDGSYLLYSQVDENNSNIMLVSNFH